MIDQNIFEVFQRDKKVFIPDFGAFIYSEFNDAVDFNDLLTFDDGKVVAEIQKHQSITEDEARNALNSYVRDIKNTLDQGKLHFIEGFGYLAKDESGAINLRKAAHLDDAEAENISGSADDNPPSVEHPQSSGNDTFDTNTVNIPTPFEVQEHSDLSNLLTDNEIDILNEETSSSDGDLENEDDRYTTIQDAQTEYEEHLEIEYTEKGGKSTLKTVAWIVIPLIFLAAAVFYYFNFYKTNEIIEQRELPKTISGALLMEAPEQTEQEEGELADMQAEQNASKPEQPAVRIVPKTEFKDPAVIVSTEDEAKTYCLVLGSFKEEGNADRFQQRLQGGGMVTNKFKGRNDFYFVGIENIEGKSSAIKLLSDVKADNPNAWIINKERI